MDQEIFTSGEFAEICGITKRTLRHYHNKGLIEPEYVDKDNNYKYYTARQAPYIVVVKALKEFGFSLSDIKGMFKRFEGNFNGLLKIFKEKKKCIAKEIERLNRIKNQINPFISFFEWVNSEEYKTQDLKKIRVKKIDKRCVVYVFREGEINFIEYTKGRNELEKIVEDNNLVALEPTMSTIYHTTKDYDRKCAKYDIMKVLKNYDTKKGLLNNHIKEIPSSYYASIIHKGPHENLSLSVNKLIEWIKDHNYVITFYLTLIFHVGRILPDDQLITEIQIPIAKNTEKTLD